jgi:hypothetical protein
MKTCDNLALWGPTRKVVGPRHAPNELGWSPVCRWQLLLRFASARKAARSKQAGEEGLWHYAEARQAALEGKQIVRLSECQPAWRLCWSRTTSGQTRRHHQTALPHSTDGGVLWGSAVWWCLRVCPEVVRLQQSRHAG